MRSQSNILKYMINKLDIKNKKILNIKETHPYSFIFLLGMQVPGVSKKDHVAAMRIGRVKDRIGAAARIFNKAGFYRL